MISLNVPKVTRQARVLQALSTNLEYHEKVDSFPLIPLKKRYIFIDYRFRAHNLNNFKYYVDILWAFSSKETMKTGIPKNLNTVKKPPFTSASAEEK